MRVIAHLRGLKTFCSSHPIDSNLHLQSLPLLYFARTNMLLDVGHAILGITKKEKSGKVSFVVILLYMYYKSSLKGLWLPGEFAGSVLPNLKQRGVYNGCTTWAGKYQRQAMVQRNLSGLATCLLGIKLPCLQFRGSKIGLKREGWKKGTAVISQWENLGKEWQSNS